MAIPERLPESILGGDPFNQFRFLYRPEMLWKLFDEEYCLTVMRSCFDAGGRAFDLSFDINARLFQRLEEEKETKLIGFGNPTWEQGIILNHRYLQYSRDRILRTLVDRFFPSHLGEQVKTKLARELVLMFDYDRNAEPLSDKEIAAIYLDQDLFAKRLSIFKGCKYIFLGGSDADWFVSLGRVDLLHEMVRMTRQMGYVPLILCQFATYIIPMIETAKVDIEGYAIPFNQEWGLFDRDGCVSLVKTIDKPFIAFRPLAGGMVKNIRTALDWLYKDTGVASILFGAATQKHAYETTKIAIEARAASDFSKTIK
jgi:hypothetical protein